MKITTWNVNSINARLPNVLDWVDSMQPDILLLQELKCEEAKFPADAFEERGYSISVHGQKSWNGVAILSKSKPDAIRPHLPHAADDDAHSRYIEADFGSLTVASIYLPNGNPIGTEKFPYKLDWMDRLQRRAAHLLRTRKHVILAGDYNIIPEAIDCHNPLAWKDDALFRPESRRRFRSLLNLGYVECWRALHPHTVEYSFWDYQAGAWPRNNGIRIDHFLASPAAFDMVAACDIDKAPRAAEKASDHVPVTLTLNMAA